MVAEAARALAAIPPDVAALRRPPRDRLFLPVLRALLGPLAGLRCVEVGTGEPLLLARALAAEGMSVDAVDPVLAGVEAPAAVVPFANDVLDDPPALAPASVVLSSMWFGAPLRQRARRELWPRYVAGDRPTEAEVHGVLARIEREAIARLARWTAPGGWNLHWSLEGLFAAPDDAWRDAGFDAIHRADGWLLARRGPRV